MSVEYYVEGNLATKAFAYGISGMFIVGNIITLVCSLLFFSTWFVSLFFILIFLMSTWWIFLSIKYYFCRYWINKDGIMLRDGYGKTRSISWQECQHIRIASVVTGRLTRNPNYSVGEDIGYPFLIFSKEPVDLSCDYWAATNVVQFVDALRRKKLIMVPMTSKNVEFVNKFFDIEPLLQAELPANCYDWQNPKTWGKDQ